MHLKYLVLGAFAALGASCSPPPTIIVIREQPEQPQYQSDAEDGTWVNRLDLSQQFRSAGGYNPAMDNIYANGPFPPMPYGRRPDWMGEYGRATGGRGMMYGSPPPWMMNGRPPPPMFQGQVGPFGFSIRGGGRRMGYGYGPPPPPPPCGPGCVY